MVQKRGLGRGLGAIIPGAEARDDGVRELRITEIETNPFQPRKHFDEAALGELAATIGQHGVLTPIVVRRGPRGYQVIAGERRVRAARLAGLLTVPAVFREASDSQALEMALVENLQREDLNPLESAESYQRLMQEFGLTQEDLAKRLGRDRSSVANALRLLRLPEKIRQDVATGALTEGHARAILGLERPAEQLKVRDQVLKRDLTVRATEALVRRLRGEQPPRPQRAVGADPNISALEDQLRGALGTKVRIAQAGKGGLVEIAYYSPDDLTRIVECIVGAG